MRRLLLVLLICLGLTACGEDAATVKSELQQQYAALDKALTAKDLTAFLKPVDASYTFITANGKTLNYDAVKSSTADSFKESEVTAVTTIGDVRPKGKTAEVNVTSVETGRFKDPHGQTHTIEATTQTVDTWKKTADGWKLVASKEQAHSTKKDGVAVTPGAK